MPRRSHLGEGGQFYQASQSSVSACQWDISSTLPVAPLQKSDSNSRQTGYGHQSSLTTQASLSSGK